MKENDLFKVFVGEFSMLDENGKPTNYYKKYDLFKNTYGIVFFIQAKTKGRCWGIYFARDEGGWNYRTVFPVGKLIDDNNTLMIKTGHNSFVWHYSNNISEEKIESLFQWVKENGETYISGLKKHPGIPEYLSRDRHSATK